MPLEHGKSKKAFSHNVEAEMHAGKPQGQSLAIAYSMKKKAKKMAEGGMMTKDGYQSECDEHCNHPGMPHPQASGFVGHEGNMVKHDGAAMHEDERMLNQHGEHEVGAGGYAEGGHVSPMHGEQTEAHDEDMVGRIMKQRAMQYSEGGKVANDDHAFEYEFKEPANYDDLSRRDDLEQHYTGANSGDELGNEYDADHDDMVSRIMLKRKKQHNPNPA